MKRKVILYFLLIISLLIFLYSSYHIICWCIDNQKTKEQIEEVQKYIKDDSKNISTPEIDFQSLYKQNTEVKGWIKVPNTNIDYPFVQHQDNTFYLTHSFNKKYNNAGWIFLDYRNDIDFLNTNTIIYGHGRVDGTMFGSLKNILNEDILNNQKNFNIYLYLPNKTYTFEIFSAYHVKTTNDYLKTEFTDEKEYEKFLTLIKSRSKYKFSIDVNSHDKILTLSTCYNDREKMVVHAKLIT